VSWSEELPAFEIKVGQRELFLDDVGVAHLENLLRTMHRPVKRGAVIRSPDPSQTLQTRTAPVWNPVTRRYMLWVLGIDQTLWESGDGLHWQPAQKPNMPIDMAVYDANEPNPALRFKAALLNEGFAVSPDGITWTKLDVPKISSQDEGNFSFDSASGLFVHTVKRRGPFGRSLAIATSRDFQTWSDFGVVFHADETDQRLGRENITARFADPTLEPPHFRNPEAYNVDVYNKGVFWYEGLYVGLPAMYHATGKQPNYPNTDGFHLVELTCSRDLKTWKRLGERQAFLGPSRIDSGAYDLTQIIGPSAPVVRDDELWFYYTGLKYRANWDYEGTYPNGKAILMPGKDRDVGAVCLAVLRRDGFISLDARNEPGTLTTPRCTLPAGRLFVNVDARGGEFRAEIENENGQVVARSAVVRVDSPRQAITWEQGELAALAGQRVALRFHLRNAQFYSYWFER
jgi:hypothetical protein